MGPNAIIQGALATILSSCPDSFFQHAIHVVQVSVS